MSKPISVRVAPTVTLPKHPQEGAKGDSKPGDLNPGEAAHYIAAMTVSLDRLAQAYDLSFLSYLLGMVIEEARRIMASPAASPQGGDKDSETR